MLSVQNLLDCGWSDGDIGSCNGGSWVRRHHLQPIWTQMPPPEPHPL
jgi:hypothetical protein